MARRDRALLLISHIMILAGRIQRDLLNSPEVVDASVLAGLSNAADYLLELEPVEEVST